MEINVKKQFKLFQNKIINKNKKPKNSKLSPNESQSTEEKNNISTPNISTDTIEYESSSKDIEQKDEEENINVFDSLQSLEPDIDVEEKWIEDSPYAEVRAAVSPTDDPNMPVNTIRMWILLTVFVLTFASVNQFFSLRYPTLSISFIVAQLLSFPVGKLTEFLPSWEIGCGKWKTNLNPGPFSIKEHAAITISVSLTASASYAMNIVVAQIMFYKQDLSIGYQLLLVLTTQTLGYGLAGLTRRWIVYPASMIWPQTLVSAVLFKTLHNDYNFKKQKEIINGWKLSRYRFFWYVAVGSFAWYWLPGCIFKALSYCTWICWIAPKNIKINQLFGYHSGLGIIPVTFDWNQVVTAMGSPLPTPWWVIANTFGSIVFFYFLIVPILYYKGVWYSDYIPMLSSSTFDRYGNIFNVSRILTNDYKLDYLAYKSYSPLYLSMSYTFTYSLSFAAVVAIFVHCILYHGKEIIERLKSNKGHDIHKKLMEKYPEAPIWWYLIIFSISFGLSIFVVIYYDTQLPFWGFLVAFGISLVNFLPQGILEGITNQHIGLNIITEMIGGYMLPNKPIANLLVKLYGFIPMRQGLDFSADLKLGQYMKIPPRILFITQIYATILASLANVGVFAWMRNNIPNLCEANNINGFNCANSRTVFNASIIYGAVGPMNLFSKGNLYYPLLFFFLVGAIAPIITFLLTKKFPKIKWLKYVNAPIFFNGPGEMPPATGINYSSWALVGFTFNYLIRKRYTSWWNKYNYVLSAALDSGVAIATVLIFLCVTYPGATLSWWGNNVYKNTADWNSTPYKTLKEGETFGLTQW